MVDNIENLLDKAYLLHTSGKFHEAKLIYEKFISLYPNNPDALNLYAQLLLQIGEFRLSIDFFEKVFLLTKNEQTKYYIAKAYFLLNDFEKSLNFLINIKEKNINNLKLLANVYQNLNKIDELIDVCVQIYNIDNNDLANIFRLASILDSLNDKINLIFFLEKAFSIDLNNENLCEKLILEYSQINNFKKIKEYSNFCLKINPSNLIALLNLSSVYLNDNDYEKAFEYLNIAQNFHTDNLNVFCQKFSIYRKMKKWTDCINIAKIIITKFPENHLGYGYLAEAYYESVDLNIAAEYYKKALFFKNNDVQYMHNLSRCYIGLKKYNKAIVVLNKIIQLKIDDIETHKLISFVYLTQKLYKKAMENYFYVFNPFNIAKEHSKLINLNDKSLIYAEKIWNNEQISNSKLLIYNNVGYGDFILMSRYIYNVASKAKRVVLEVSKPLYKLYYKNFKSENIDVVLEKQEPYKNYDKSTSTMSLLYNAQLDFAHIPFSEGWLKVEQEKINEISKLNIFDTNKKKIGIFYRGNTSVMPNRHIDLKELMPIFNLDKYLFYSLDIEKKDENEIKFFNDNNIIDCSKYINDFYDTAAIIKNLDLVITIDSSIVHLAGALSVDTYLLIPYSSEWRWFEDTKITPWYNSVTLFKQKIPADWKSVVNDVLEILNKKE